MARPTNEVTLAEIAGSKGAVVFVNTDTSVEDTAKLLQSKRYAAVPVFDEETKQFVGFIDEIDILSFAVVVAHSALEKKKLTSKKLREKFAWFTDDELQKFNFSHGTVGEILQLPGAERRRMYVFQSNAKLANAMQILCEHRRILVRHTAKGFFSGFFPENTTSLVTQTDVLKYISSHVSDARFGWSSVLNSKLCTLSLSSSFVSVKSSLRAIDGLLWLLENGVNAVAIVDDATGRLEQSLTPSHISPLSQASLSKLLDKPVELAKTHPNTPPTVTGTMEQTLIEVIQNMLRVVVHEVWIVDKDSKPIALVTMSDVIKLALAALENPI